MAHLIDKSALVAEIERMMAEEMALFEESLKDDSHEISAAPVVYTRLQMLLSAINTLEIKEVDLEKHLKEDIEDVFFDLNGVAVKGATHYLTVEDVKDVAKHFFELGLKAQFVGAQEECEAYIKTKED